STIKSTTKTKETNTSSSKTKRLSVFKKQWIKDSKYAGFLQECKTSPYLAHCSICKSDFSIGNGGTYLINRHLEQAIHKRLVEVQTKEKSRSMDDFVTPSSVLTKLTAAELAFVYHGVHHGHSYVSQSCTVDLVKKVFHESIIGQNITCSKTKARELSVNVLAPFFTSEILRQVKKHRFYSISFDGSSKGNIKMFPFIINHFTLQSGLVKSVLEVVNQPRETADDIVASLRDVLKMNDIDIQYMTSIGADNTNTNFGCNHSVFSLIKSEVSNLLKGNCYCHILHNSVKNSHHLLLVDIESSLSQLYSHFSSSSKRVAELKEYFEFVEEDYLRLLQHIKLRWLTLYISIARLLKVYDPLSAYFLNMDNEDEAKCPPSIKRSFSSDVAKCTLHFLHQVLFDIQTKNLELQRYGTSIADLHRIITNLLKKLNNRLEQKYFGYQTRILLNAMPKDVQEKLISSFVKYLRSIIQYIHKYYDEHSLLAESLAIFGITEIDQIKFDQIEKCVAILNLDVDHDKLFKEMISLQNTYKEVNSYREPLFVQIEKYVGGHEIEKQIVNEVLEESDDEELVHKTPTPTQTQNHQDSYHKIRPDQLWAFLITKTTTNCDEMTKLVSYAYSIPCSNAFAEGVFSHMKHLWTNSRSSMLSETVAAELKIRLN
ncbi:unnamed protein product, partial [Rotaria sp. Silwood1]